MKKPQKIGPTLPAKIVLYTIGFYFIGMICFFLLSAGGQFADKYVFGDNELWRTVLGAYALGGFVYLIWSKFSDDDNREEN